MAYKITDQCVNCGSCEGECPVGAIAEANGARGKISFRYGTIINIMISFPMTHEITTIFQEDFSNFFFIFCHYANTFS